MQPHLNIAWPTPVICSKADNTPIGILKCVIQVNGDPAHVVVLGYTVKKPKHVSMVMWSAKTAPPYMVTSDLTIHDWLKDVATVVSTSIAPARMSRDDYALLSPPLDPLAFIVEQYFTADGVAEADMTTLFPKLTACVLRVLSNETTIEDFGTFLKSLEIRLYPTEPLIESCVHDHTFDLIKRLDVAIERNQDYLTCGKRRCDQRYPLSAVAIMSTDPRIHERLPSSSSSSSLLDTTEATNGGLMPSGSTIDLEYVLNM